MNWGYDDALITADRHVFFKIMLRSVAEAHGFRVTFMPKPYLNRTGSGAHVHVSAWGGPGTPNQGKNLFHDPDGELQLSSLAYNFIAGVLGSAEGLCALTNPTVNSYKRLNASVTRSGATWSPNTVTYTGNNRTHMIRIPDVNRFEFRLPVRAREGGGGGAVEMGVRMVGEMCP
jgi:glutamine synthetase